MSAGLRPRRLAAVLLSIPLALAVLSGGAQAKGKPAPSGSTSSRPVIQLVSGNLAGAAGNARSTSSDITPDGRYVVFQSAASDLVSGDTNGRDDVFLRDRSTGTTSRVSVGNDGQQLSNGFHPSISDDGRFVAFASSDRSLNPPSLVPDPGLLGTPLSIALRDRQLGTTTLISRTDLGQRAEGDFPSISGDGCRIAWETYSYSYLFDCSTGKRTRIGPPDAYEPQVSGDGKFVAYTVYDPGTSLVYRLDIASGVTELVSVDNSGNGADARQPSISRDGDKVTFSSYAPNLTANYQSAVFLRDLSSKTTKMVSVSSTGLLPDASSRYGSISPDGTQVAFVTSARNLTSNANGLQQVYLHTLSTGSTNLISYGLSGKPSSGHSHFPVVSNAGSVVAFVSDAGDLVRNDTNATYDVFAAVR